MTGTVATGIIVIVIYEVAKWGVAGALAPVSGGTSLAGAAYNLFAYCGNNPMNIHTGWSDTNNVFVFNIFKLLDKIRS